MDATTLIIILLAGGALFYLFGGRFRQGAPSEAEGAGAAGNSGGGCCGGSQTTSSRKRNNQADVDAWVDPVCGMPVETKHAAAMKRYKGTTFYFCSEKCRAAFARNPRKYVKKEELERQPVRSSSGGHGCCG
jgi:YHS domain-containing protein